MVFIYFGMINAPRYLAVVLFFSAEGASLRWEKILSVNLLSDVRISGLGFPFLRLPKI